MKVWRFYLVPKESDDYDQSVDVKRKYPLYAITSSKALAEEFRATRNRSRFVERKSKMTKEEWLKYSAEHQSTVLGMTTLKTKDKDYKKTEVRFCMPRYEVDTILESDGTALFEEAEMATMPSPFIFKPEYMKALNKLNYLFKYKIYNTDKIDRRTRELLDAYLPDEIFEMWDVNEEIDRLWLLLNDSEFGPTISLDGEDDDD